MKKVSNRFTKYIINIVLTALLYGLLYHGTMAIFYKYMPSSYWFDYETIMPIKKEFKVKEKVIFMSDSNIKKKVDMKWVDVMICDYYDGIGYRLYASLTQEYSIIPVGDTMEPWVFNIEGPSRPAKCYLKTFATARLLYGIKKTQTIISGPFLFVK